MEITDRKYPLTPKECVIVKKRNNIFDNIIIDKRLKATLDKIVEWECFEGTFDDFFTKYTPESLLTYKGMGIGKINKLKEILINENTATKKSIMEQMKIHSDELEKCYRKIRQIIKKEIDGY